MLVQTPEQIILLLLIQLRLFGQTEINTSFEIFFQKVQGFVGVIRGSQCRKGRVSVLAADRFETLVDSRQQIGQDFSFTAYDRVAQARPLFQRMKTEPALVAQPTLVNIDVTASDGPINLPVRRRVAGNSATGGAG